MYDQYLFDSGRNALRYLIRLYNIKSMHVPYYLCDVIRHTMFKESCKPIFYHIDDKFYPAKIFPETDYILYPNYFGICSNNVKKLIKTYSHVIVDNAHAYYDAPSGFACFNTGRKFGYQNSYLWIKNNNHQVKKIEHLQKYNNDKYTRKKIFLRLHEKFAKINLLQIDTNSIPFVYPCLLNNINDADNLVDKLNKEGKIVYRYWNYLPKSFNEYKFYSRLVPIPILPYVD